MRQSLLLWRPTGPGWPSTSQSMKICRFSHVTSVIIAVLDGFILANHLVICMLRYLTYKEILKTFLKSISLL